MANRMKSVVDTNCLPESCQCPQPTRDHFESQNIFSNTSIAPHRAKVVSYSMRRVIYEIPLASLDEISSLMNFSIYIAGTSSVHFLSLFPCTSKI